jgi:hypothetical protein
MTAGPEGAEQLGVQLEALIFVSSDRMACAIPMKFVLSLSIRPMLQEYLH